MNEISGISGSMPTAPVYEAPVPPPPSAPPPAPEPAPASPANAPETVGSIVDVLA